MKLQIYTALMKINISVYDAKGAADSINNEIDKRYNLYVLHMLAKSDLSEPKVEIMKWTT
jgi:hypothetical protein